MADINLLLGLSNVVLIWITIYSAVLSLKWQFEDREKDTLPLKEKEALVRELVQSQLDRIKDMENTVKFIENRVNSLK